MNCNNCGNVLLPSDKVCPICSTPNPNYRKKEVKSKPNTNALMVLTAIFSLILSLLQSISFSGKKRAVKSRKTMVQNSEGIILFFSQP